MRHVKESSGKQPERGIGSGKAEAYDCEPREFQESSFARGERSGQPRESRSWKQRARTTNEGPTMNSQEMQKPTVKPQTPGNWGEETNLPVCEGTNPFGRRKSEFQNMQISDLGHLEKVFKNIKGKVIISEDAPPQSIDAFKTTTWIWGMLMSASVKAAIHVGPDYTENLEIYKKNFRNLFDITQKLLTCKRLECINMDEIFACS